MYELFSQIYLSFVAILISTHGNPSIRKFGWLDRLTSYYKRNFYKDVEKIAPMEIQAHIIHAPPGYKDSKEWDFESVVRLLTLLKESESAAPIRRALFKSLKPARRMNLAESFHRFPSLSFKHPNEFYYDIDSEDYYALGSTANWKVEMQDDDILMISNPVEARLPSASISVRLLKDIMEARANQVRVMPTTVKSTTEWQKSNSTKSDAEATTDSGSNSGNNTDVKGTGMTGVTGAVTVP